MRTTLTRRLALSAGLFLLICGGSAAASSIGSPVAIERLAGTQLTLETRVAYEWAYLEVAGGDELSLDGEFEAGEPLRLELLTETGEILPDGLYHYRLRLTLADGSSSGQTGAFFIESGRLLAREEKRSELSDIRRSLGERQKLTPAPPQPSVEGLLGRPAEINGFVDDFIRLLDAVGDGWTWIGFESDDASAYSSYWSVENYFGNMRLTFMDRDVNTEYETIMSLRYHNTSGEYYTTIGGDEAPGNLHVKGVNLPEIFLTDVDDGAQVEIELYSNGDLAFHLDPGAGLEVEGDLRAFSSREAKENFTDVSSEAILTAVADLPIQRWNFKGDRRAEHIGPVAEDFHEAFGLGADNRHISPADTGGIALAAIQALSTENAELRRAIEALTERLRAVESSSRSRAAPPLH